MIKMKNPLAVVVNDELTLQAGWWEVTEAPQSGPVRRVHPPEPTMHEQLITYLIRHDTLNIQPARRCSWRKQALALTNICLRWGSYLAVLADRQKSLYAKAKGEAYRPTSHLSDGEMRRINIEMSANLAWWIDLLVAAPNRYLELVERALDLLPLASVAPSWPEKMMFQKIGRLIVDSPETFELLQQMISLEQGQAAAQAPSRIFANALTHYSWRNGSGIEDLHAGRSGGYPLKQRRLGPSDEGMLFNEVAMRMEDGLVTLRLLAEAPGEWSQKVAWFNQMPFLTPGGWTLTESTCEFSLDGSE